MTERRYTDAEITRIFELAAEAQHADQPSLRPGEGMTLAQIQEIGREAGFTAEQLSRAAKAISLEAHHSERRFLGFPIGVGLTAELGRTLSEAEWERLVVDLRETFDARGVLKQEGSFRSWTNGNLQALLEPTETGQRLRIRSLKGDSRSLMAVGLATFASAAVTGLVGIATNAGADLLITMGSISTFGAGLFGAGALRIRPWARKRLDQMHRIIGRATAVGRDERLPDIPGPDTRKLK